MLLLYSTPILDEVYAMRQIPQHEGRLVVEMLNSDYCWVDRTGTLDFGYNAKPYLPLPESPKATPEFEEIALRRASELIAQSRERGLPLRVFYSGGIDSAWVLLSFIEADPEWTRENLTIACTDMSRIEFPSLWKRLKKEGYRIAKHKGADIRREIDEIGIENALWVTGDMAAMIYGQVRVGVHDVGGLKALLQTSKWQDVFVNSRSDKGFTKKQIDFVLEYLDPLVQKAPFELKTYFDWYWWMIRAMRHADVRFNYGMQSTGNYKLVDKHIIHFVDCESFEQWSMDETNHREEKFNPEAIGEGYEGWHTYKWAQKKLIQKWHPDDLYFKYKAKASSMLSLPDRDYVLVAHSGEYVQLPRLYMPPCDAGFWYNVVHGEKYDHLLGIGGK